MARLRHIALLAALAISLAGRSLPAVTIDDFTAGPFALEAARFETESVTLTNLPTSSVLGGSRFVTLNGLGPTPESSVRVAVDDATGEFRYDADQGASAANFRVSYGWSNDLQADLLADGANALVFDFAFADFETDWGFFDINVLTEPGGRYLYVPVQNSADPFSLVLPYRAFETGSAGANFANVSRIAFGTGNGNLHGDFTLTAIRTDYFPDGDYNFDRSVDELDYSVWTSLFGNEGPYWGAYPVAPADGNRDGYVDVADYVMWRKHRGTAASGTAASSPVPEPHSIWIGLLALTGAAAFERSRIVRSLQRRAPGIRLDSSSLARTLSPRVLRPL
jgi:hypothetical protein